MTTTRTTTGTTTRRTITAPAKVNLHLEVLGLRPDGFHELAMVMQSIDLADRITAQPRDDGCIVLHCGAAELPSDADNLIVRAAHHLRRCGDRPELGATLTLEKRIPIGAGLAGGSSDAAATLVLLDQVWQLQRPRQELERLAADLGSDVPFCLAGGSQLCFGRGEILEPLPPPTGRMAVLLVKDPQVTVATPWAYGRCREQCGHRYLSDEAAREGRRQALRRADWLTPLRADRPPPLRNDLQEVVAAATPAVRRALALLAGAPGRLGAAMSGSGPSCFALFPDLAAATAARRRLLPELQAAGLASWCCALRPDGVRLEP
jgi:4-diphosphocytidyl-2-C-methyl-D-erythritol kinase